MRRAGSQVERVEAARQRLQLIHRDGREAVVALGGEPLKHILGNVHAAGRHRDDIRAETRERVDQRMNRAAEFQIAAERDGESLQMALFLAQDVEVAERLRRMLAAAVAGVEHGAWRVLGGHARGAVMWMAQHDQVSIAGDDAHRVGEALALGRGARLHIGRADHRAAQTMHRGFETEARARRRLVKQRRHDQSGRRRDLFAAFELGGKAVGQRKHALDVRGLEILDRNDVEFCQA